MKILDNNVTREMTEEEIELFLRDAENIINDEISDSEALDIILGGEI